MSTITRAFTTRRVRQSTSGADENMPQRSNTTKAGNVSIRNKISGPVQLVHTTNMLSYNAPDLFPPSATSTTSGSSLRSDDESDRHTQASSPPTSPDIASAPKSEFAEYNHLSSYFNPSARAPGQPEPPLIPKRAPSHTSKPSESLLRKQSNSRLSEHSSRTASTKASFSFSRVSSSGSSVSTSHNSVQSQPYSSRVNKASISEPRSFVQAPAPAIAPAAVPAPPPQHRRDYSGQQHPFGQELAQVSEIAEEYGVRERLNAMDAEERQLASMGLRKFTAADYIAEVEKLSRVFFPEQLRPAVKKQLPPSRQPVNQPRPSYESHQPQAAAVWI